MSDHSLAKTCLDCNNISCAPDMLMNIQGGVAQVPAREEKYVCFCCNAGWARCARALPPSQQRTDSSTVATRKWNYAGMLRSQLKSTRVRCNWCQPEMQRGGYWPMRGVARRSRSTLTSRVTRLKLSQQAFNVCKTASRDGHKITINWCRHVSLCAAP
jgi:hypothetical protein